MTGRPSVRLLRDERGLIRSLLLQAAIIFAILGITLYEGGQVLVAQVKAQSVASAAARAGAETYSRTKGGRRLEQTQAAALEAASVEDPDTRVVAVEVGADGSVTVIAEKTALTMIVDKVSFLRPFGVRQATVREAPLPP
jgi:Flp pilus assembly protein TadG